MEGGHRWKIDVSAAVQLFRKDGRFAEIIAWRPLPEPYSPKRREDHDRK